MATKVAALERRVEEVKEEVEVQSEEKLFEQMLDVVAQEAILQEQDIDDSLPPQTPTIVNPQREEEVTPGMCHFQKRHSVLF